MDGSVWYYWNSVLIVFGTNGRVCVVLLEVSIDSIRHQWTGLCGITGSQCVTCDISGKKLACYPVILL